MAEKEQLHISVRSLVEFIFREGDIDNRGGTLQNPQAMQEGSRIHRKLQKAAAGNYQAEVPLKLLLSEELYDLTLEGRADGIFTRLEDGRETVWIDEIKGIYRRLDTLEEPVYVHWAQAACYAYIYALQQKRSEMGIRMTYCNLDTEEVRQFSSLHSFEELSSWFEGLWDQYRKWALLQCESRKARQASIRTLKFPFEYRDGQKKLAQDVYRTILRKKTLFLQAPTGVGKTISTLYPAVKAVGEGLSEHIFYLTAKTVTAQVARDTFQILLDQGYRGRIIQLTAKEKLCICEETDCNPLACPCAAGHFNRVNDAVYDLLTGGVDLITRETVLEYAAKYQVCPFEMMLDVSVFCDDIICDYNYVFDPNVCLKRYFADNVRGHYLFLVDEAHNLVDRSREMYSAQVCKEDFLAMKKRMKEISPAICRKLEKCNSVLLKYKRTCEGFQKLEDISDFLLPLMRLASDLDEFLQKPGEVSGRKEILDFYFQIRNFLNVCDLMDEHYVIWSEMTEEGRFLLHLYCVDPSKNIQACLDRADASVLFSATLLPVNYYKSLLSSRTDNYAVYAQSTFSQDQRLLLLARDVSTRYNRRGEAEYTRIARYILQAVQSRNGNYIAFFPSYKVLQEVYLRFQFLLKTLAEEEALPEVLEQKAQMSEEEREAFLGKFEEERDRSMIAFCVLGGIFGEGIDLKNDRLIGVIVAGTGIPQVGYERTILKDYFDEKGEDGFAYAYRYPGMNKVLQAAGRVIRTTEDTGVILLLDDRFLTREYQAIFPREWEKRQTVSLADASGYMEAFWKSFKNSEVAED